MRAIAVNDICKLAAQTREELLKIDMETEEITESEIYDSSYKFDVRMEAEKNKRKIVDNASAKCKEIAESYESELDKLFLISIANTKQDEIKDLAILESSIPLKEKDLKALIENNSNSRVMRRLIYKYAESHNIALTDPLKALVHREKIDIKTKLIDGFNIAIKWYYHSAYDRIIDSLRAWAEDGTDKDIYQA